MWTERHMFETRTSFLPAASESLIYVCFIASQPPLRLAECVGNFPSDWSDNSKTASAINLSDGAKKSIA